MRELKESIRGLVDKLKEVSIERHDFVMENNCCEEMALLQHEIKRIMQEFSNVMEDTKNMTDQLNDAYQVIERSPVEVFQWTLHEDIPTHYVSGNVSQYGYLPDDFYTGHLKDYWNFIHEDDRILAKERVYEARQRKIPAKK